MNHQLVHVEPITVLINTHASKYIATFDSIKLFSFLKIHAYTNKNSHTDTPAYKDDLKCMVGMINNGTLKVNRNEIFTNHSIT